MVDLFCLTLLPIQNKSEKTITMSEKKKPSNKSEKAATSSKKSAPKHDWDAMPTMVDIIFNGKKSETHKSNAKLLVNKGLATLA